MGLLLLPLLVFAYYKQKNTLKFWLWFFIILGSVATVLSSGVYVGIALLYQAIGLPIIWLSARFIAWCIKRFVNRKKIDVQ